MVAHADDYPSTSYLLPPRSSLRKLETKQNRHKNAQAKAMAMAAIRRRRRVDQTMRRQQSVAGF